MTTVKRFAFSVFITCCALAAVARAQTPQFSAVNITPERGRVRVQAVGEVYDLKIEVVDEAGATVFEGARAAGRQLDWDMKDARGLRVAPGSYTVTVSYTTQSGKPRKRIEQVLVAEEAGADEGAAGQRAGEGPTPRTSAASRARARAARYRSSWARTPSPTLSSRSRRPR